MLEGTNLTQRACCGRGGDSDALVFHAPRPVEQLPHLDPGLGVATLTRAWWDVDNHSSNPDRIIVAYGGLVGERADPVEVSAPVERPPRWRRALGRDGEASVVVGAISLEHGVGRRDGTSLRQPKLRGESVLMGGPPPLDAPLRLW